MGITPGDTGGSGRWGQANLSRLTASSTALVADGVLSSPGAGPWGASVGTRPARSADTRRACAADTGGDEGPTADAPLGSCSSGGGDEVGGGSASSLSVVAASEVGLAGGGGGCFRARDAAAAADGALPM